MFGTTHYLRRWIGVSGQLYVTPGEETRCLLDSLCECQKWPGRFRKQKKLLPLSGFEPWVIQPVAYSLYRQCCPVLQTCVSISTFRGQCILIHSFNKSQRDALLFKFILISNCTCFGQIYCPSSGVSTLYTQQQVFVMLVMLTVWQLC